MESKQSTRLYVLDTNVLIHDPQSPLNFKEHAVAIPMVVLEELDHLKTNKQSVSADARQAIRLIDSLLGEACRTPSRPASRSFASVATPSARSLC